jgi:hypothetical protein
LYLKTWYKYITIVVEKQEKTVEQFIFTIHTVTSPFFLSLKKTFSMSIELLEKYKAYYAVRSRRYSGNENFRHSEKAEQNLSSMIQSCSTLEEIGVNMGNLNELCGVALLKDQYLLELAHFKKHQEVVRAREAELVLEQIDRFDNIMDLITFVNEISAKVRIEISMDESHPMQFFGDIFQIENWLVWSQAQVPDQYKHIPKRIADEIRESLIKGVLSTEEQNNHWLAGWKVNPDICFEPRHIRKSPVSAENLKELREVYRTLVNR